MRLMRRDESEVGQPPRNVARARREAIRGGAQWFGSIIVGGRRSVLFDGCWLLRQQISTAGRQVQRRGRTAPGTLRPSFVDEQIVTRILFLFGISFLRARFQKLPKAGEKCP